MPNLRQSIIEDFWQKKDNRVSRILGWMESMEDWIQDDNEDVAEAIFSLAKTIENVSEDNIIENHENFIKLTAYLSSPRALRLIEWFDENFKNNSSIDMLKKAKEMNNEYGDILVDRLETLNRLSLLSKMFSPRRTRLLVELLKNNTSSP